MAILMCGATQKPIRGQVHPGGMVPELQRQRWALKHSLCISCDRFDQRPSYLQKHIFRF